MFLSIFKKILIWKLSWVARLVLWKYKPQIIAITGSVGKTGTKSAVCAVVSQYFFARCSEKSFNSEIGVPLTILGVANPWGNIGGWIKVFAEGLLLLLFKNHYPHLLVLEIGTDRPGDINSLTRWLKPDIAIFTEFPKIPVHVEFFATREALIKEKTYLAYALKDSGTLILNADDAEVLNLKEKIQRTVLTYGLHGKSDIKIRGSEILYQNEIPFGIGISIEFGGSVFPVQVMDTIGTWYAHAAAAACAVGVTLGVSAIESIRALKNWMVPPGRLRIVKGVHGSLIIDDTYNSSPIAAEAALRALHAVRGARKIAVLGDMLELGNFSLKAHKQIGMLSSRSADVLITVGPRARIIGESALEHGFNKEHWKHFDSSIDAGNYVRGILRKGDIALFKASQSIRLEKGVALVLEKPEEAKKILVRQEREWQIR